MSLLLFAAFALLILWLLRAYLFGVLPRLAVLTFAVLIGLQVAALAQAAAPVEPVGDGLLGGMLSLWGPLLGVVAAFVLFFDRLAKVIPNGATSTIAQVALKVATVLGVKVPDRQ